jgi:hypothetical protein
VTVLDFAFVRGATNDSPRLVPHVADLRQRTRREAGTHIDTCVDPRRRTCVELRTCDHENPGIAMVVAPRTHRVFELIHAAARQGSGV